MMKIVRLLYLTSESHPTFRSDVKVLFGKCLPKHGVFSDLVTSNAIDAGDKCDWGGGDVVLCNTSGEQSFRHHLVKGIHCLKAILRADKTLYDAIQVRDMPILAVFCLLFSRLTRVPFYYWASYPIPDGQIYRAKKTRKSRGFFRFLGLWLRGQIGRVALYQIVTRFSAHIFVQSEQMKKDFALLGVDNVKMTSVPMGVDIESIVVDQQDKDNAEVDVHKLVYLGTLERPREIQILFQMLALLSERIPDIKLILVGDTVDSNHRQWLKEQASASGVADLVTWTGWLPIKEAWRIVGEAEIGLSPFPRGYLLDSASPTKVPEYLALGLPVVCNDNPDQKKVIDESGAGYCVDYTPEDFARAVEALLSESKDSRRNRIAGGRSFVRQFRDYAVIAKELASTYHRLSNR
jgi:glycosyltransferase involved in cell wall biosynthesis